VVRTVVTAPLVGRDGGLLAGAGLDRAREVVFRIEPGLLALVPPDPGAITDAEVVEALRFLVDEWLCDVATGFRGRVVLLAFALTLIERVLLPERPAFFVTAGQRGGGKTTVIMMLVAAVLGRRPDERIIAMWLHAHCRDRVSSTPFLPTSTTRLRAVDEEAEGLTGKQAQRSSEATLFASMAQRASKPITRIQIAAADEPPVAPAVA
jgi:hypothetical protein